MIVGVIGPLSDSARAVGTALALVVASAAVLLTLQLGRSTWAEGARRRRLVAIVILFALAVALAAGVWVHPGVRPRLFLSLWLLVLAGTTTVLWIAGFDLLAVRQQERRERRELVDQHREQLRSSRNSAPKPSANGH